MNVPLKDRNRTLRVGFVLGGIAQYGVSVEATFAVSVSC